MAIRARSALFTLFGDVVRPSGGEAWLSTLTAAMEALGFTAQATRTALHRMTTEGWVEPRRTGRYAAYRLTQRGVDRLEEAAERIYRLRASDWDGRWRLLLLPADVLAQAPGVDGRDARAGGNGTPPAAVDERAPTRLVRTLAWMGFGRLSDDVFVSPHDHGDRAAALLRTHGVTGAFEFLTTASGMPATAGAAPGAAIPGAATSGATAGSDDRRIVERAWDLAALRAAHAAFLARWPAGTPEPESPRDAFVTRLLLVHDWRSFLFSDPGLPAALLPADWLGTEAALRFRERYDATAAQAWGWWTDLHAAHPAAAGGPAVPDPTQSPFALGLDALERLSP